MRAHEDRQPHYAKFTEETDAFAEQKRTLEAENERP